jgi:hypothetical protein
LLSGSPLDLSMTDRIKKGRLKAFTIIPPLVTTWKTGGVKDSDIDDMNAKEAKLKEGQVLEVGSKTLKKRAREEMSKTPHSRYPGKWE